MLCELWLPARASEQGNVIGLVSVYIYVTGFEKRDIIAQIMILRYRHF